MRKLLTMCSSKGRPQGALRMYTSWLKTHWNENGKIVIYVSEDDPKIGEYRAIPELPIEYGPNKTMVEVLNYLSCEKYPDQDFYSEVNDDHVYRTEGWDVRMMDAIESRYNGVSIAYGQTEGMPTATMSGAKVVRAFGYFFPPIFRHTWVDNWMCILHRATGFCIHVPDVLIEHMHPVFEKAPTDATYRSVYLNQDTDKQLYDRWFKEQKDQDINKLKALIDQSFQNN